MAIPRYLACFMVVKQSLKEASLVWIKMAGSSSASRNQTIH